jgi:hypothetical protein
MIDDDALLAEVLALLYTRHERVCPVLRAKRVRDTRPKDRLASPLKKADKVMVCLYSRSSASSGVWEHRTGVGRRAPPLKIPLPCRMYVYKHLSVNNFHRVLAGNLHECSLKSNIEKISILHAPLPLGSWRQSLVPRGGTPGSNSAAGSRHQHLNDLTASPDGRLLPRTGRAG